MRRNKFQTIQKYFCTHCKKHFTNKKLKNTSYPAKVILDSLSLYNLGYTQKTVMKLISKRYKKKVSRKTISNWINSHKKPCTYYTLRKEAVKSYKPQEVIRSEKLQHKQVYNFKLHMAKLDLLAKRKALPKENLRALRSYLEKVTGKDSGGKPFPHHIFTIGPKNAQQEKRASKLKMDLLKITRSSKKNYANKLTELALKISPNNYARHQSVQDFMLVNDSVTVAAEVPVYLTKNDIAYFKSKNFNLNFKNYRTPITGHIDLVQIRNGLIYILDYKPEAAKINPVEQLTVYALATAARTKLPVKSFKCAWFDSHDYYEFFPLEAVHKKPA